MRHSCCHTTGWRRHKISSLHFMSSGDDARDLDILCADGVYDLAHVVPLDMFPQNATCRVRGGFAAKFARDAQ
jgi:hypothetical protein